MHAAIFILPMLGLVWMVKIPNPRDAGAVPAAGDTGSLLGEVEKEG